MDVKVLAIVAVTLWIAAAAEPNIPRRPKYEFFDDYLLSITAEDPRAHNQVLKEEEGRTHPRDPLQPTPQTNDTATDNDQQTNQQTNQEESTVDILDYFRDVPRRHWSCCMLGKLAGDKGFHCDANFYATRITRRNRNRAHNRRMLFQGRDPIPNWGMNIMSTFERCISRHAAEFHKCCYAATIERQEIDRWHYYREGTGEYAETSGPESEE